MVTRRRVVATALAIVVAVLVPIGAALSIVPVSARLAAPLACPSDTETTEVEARWSGTARGGRNLSWELYCMDADGYGTIPSTFRIVLGLAAIWGAILLAGFLFLWGRGHMRRRRDAPARDHAR